MVATCNRCGIELVVGSTWTERLKRLQWNICSGCHNEHRRQYYRKQHPLKNKPIPVCRTCGIRLVIDGNWYPSHVARHQYICNACHTAEAVSWRHNHPSAYQAMYTRSNRKQGHMWMGENKACGIYLGVHIAELVLSRVFKDVERMPLHNKGFDFICNHGKKIDVKAACLGKTSRWVFTIKRNVIADYFLCLAFDNRDDLNPMHLWLLPGAVVNNKIGATVSLSMTDKWERYELDKLDHVAAELLQRFGSVQGVMSASIDDLCAVPGVGKTTAVKIREIVGDNFNNDECD